MYHRDRDIWIGTPSEAHSFSLNSLLQLYSGYYRSNPTTFQMIKDKTGNHALKPFLSKHGINVRIISADINTGKAQIFIFEDDKDHFLFNLKFGAYRY